MTALLFLLILSTPCGEASQGLAAAEIKSGFLGELTLAREDISWITNLSVQVTKNRAIKNLIKDCSLRPCTQNDVQAAARGFILGSQISLARTKGIATIVTLMIGSAVLTTTMSAHLPAKLQFMTHFLGQLSALGIYVIGAPLWEPLSSTFRKWAFKQEIHHSHAKDQPLADNRLEAMWRSTQRRYSLNEQMSRNIVAQSTILATSQWAQAQVHLQEGNDEAAVKILAVTYQMIDSLFSDVGPDHPLLVATARIYFADYREKSVDLIPRISSLLSGDQIRIESALRQWFNQ